VVSFVIATKDRAALLEDCVRSILGVRVVGTPPEILVVDDGSSDNTVARMRRLETEHAGLRVVANEGRGQNAGRNTGLRHAAHDLVVLVDDDELVPPEYLAVLDEIVTAFPDAAAYGGPYRAQPGERQLPTCDRCSFTAKAAVPDAAGRYRALLGGNMAVRREAWRLVGDFDPELWGFGNETEWFVRAARHDLELRYDERLFVWHRRDYVSWAQLVRKGYRQGTRDHLYAARVGETLPSPWPELVRYSRHAVARRCTNGLFQAARQVGRAQVNLSAWWGEPSRPHGRR
jgi:glycosyltransferase involved in cell wall biosynthesis